jgi:hypothetical protein
MSFADAYSPSGAASREVEAPSRGGLDCLRGPTKGDQARHSTDAISESRTGRNSQALSANSHECSIRNTDDATSERWRA